MSRVRGKSWDRNVQRHQEAEGRMGIAYLLLTIRRLGLLVAHLQSRLHALKRRSAAQHQAIIQLRDERDRLRGGGKA